MKLDIIEALRNGLNRTLEKNGLMLAGLYFVLGVIATSASQTLFSKFAFLSSGAASNAGALAMPIPGFAAVLLALISSLASLVLSIVAIRTFVSDSTETIPEEFYSRNMPITTLNMIAGGFCYGFIVLVGLLPLMVLSGIMGLLGSAGAGATMILVVLILAGVIVAISSVMLYLMVALYFWNVIVAAEDETFIEGLKNSWKLTEDNRLRLFALGAIVTVATGAFSGFLGLPSLFGFNMLGTLLGQFGGALTAVFSVATTAQAYNQLK